MCMCVSVDGSAIVHDRRDVSNNFRRKKSCRIVVTTRLGGQTLWNSCFRAKERVQLAILQFVHGKTRDDDPRGVFHIHRCEKWCRIMAPNQELMRHYVFVIFFATRPWNMQNFDLRCVINAFRREKSCRITVHNPKMIQTCVFNGHVCDVSMGNAKC